MSRKSQIVEHIIICGILGSLSKHDIDEREGCLMSHKSQIVNTRLTPFTQLCKLTHLILLKLLTVREPGQWPMRSKNSFQPAAWFSGSV